jgi:hypothetical protein
LALGYVYFHFGVLKFFPDLSPAELLAGQSFATLCFHCIDVRTAIMLLGAAECAIGLGFLFDIRPRLVLAVFFFHMAGTFVPLFVFPEFTFEVAPFAPDIHGQYILKNIVYVAAAWTVYGDVLLRSPRPPVLERIR